MFPICCTAQCPSGHKISLEETDYVSVEGGSYEVGACLDPHDSFSQIVIGENEMLIEDRDESGQRQERDRQ